MVMRDSQCWGRTMPVTGEKSVSAPSVTESLGAPGVERRCQESVLPGGPVHEAEPGLDEDRLRRRQLTHAQPRPPSEEGVEPADPDPGPQPPPAAGGQREIREQPDALVLEA